MNLKTEGMKRAVPKLIGLLFVFGSVLSIIALYLLDINFVFEPRLLLPVTNTLFVAIIPLTVAFFAARAYVKNGSLRVLWMGCGMLSFGLCAALAGWLRPAQNGANVNVTIYNTGALLGSLFHITGAVMSSFRRPPRWEQGKEKLITASWYFGIFAFIILFTFATLQRIVPPFFIQGSGPTGLRQLVLGTAIFFYALSAIFFMDLFRKMKSGFLYWYSLCLAMLALGLFAFYIQKAVGSPIGWVGRTSNYVGAVFSLTAIWAAVRTGRSKGVPLEDIISSFFMDAEASYRSLVETASDAIISSDQDGRIILWNSGAERIFGYTKGEAIGAFFLELLIPEGYAGPMKEFLDSVKSPLDRHQFQNTVEIEAKRKEGGLLPVEISAFVRKLPNGWVSTSIVRDIHERKKAEEEILRKSALLQGINKLLRETILCETEEEVAKTGLTVAEELTGSKFGFIGEIDEKTLFHDIALSDPGWAACEMPKSDATVLIHDMEIRGIWGRVIKDERTLIVNTPSGHPDSTGIPEGHPPILSFIGVPLKDGDKTFGMIALANKKTGYDHSDAQALESIAVAFVEALSRKRVQGLLRKAYDELEIRVQERTQSLRQSEEKLRSLSTRLLSAQEEERKRISRELHDSIGSSLSAVKFGLEAAKNQIQEGTATSEGIDTLISTTQRSIDEVRRIMTDLRPSILDDLGLITTIGWFCRQFEAIYTGIRIEKQIDVEEAEIPETLKIVAFRVMQEALNNIAKYSRADWVNLSFVKRDQTIELVIEDTGVGFDVNSVFSSEAYKRGLGLTSMKERTELSGGSFSIESFIGEGTKIRGTWPC